MKPIIIFFISLILFVINSRETNGEILVDGCSNTNRSCLKFGFSYPGPNSSLSVEGQFMKNGKNRKTKNFFFFKHYIKKMKGYIFWAELVNNETGIVVGNTSYAIQLIAYDNKGTSSLVVSTYQQLITEVNFLLGTCKHLLKKRVSY